MNTRIISSEEAITAKTKLYSCYIKEQSVSLIGTNFGSPGFGISVPPGDMLILAEFILSHRTRLEQQQREIDQRQEVLVQEIKAYCTTHDLSFYALSFWDITDLLRDIAGSTKLNDQWEQELVPVEQLSPAGRWYRTVCCDESGGIYAHIWEPFYAVCQQRQQQEEETEESKRETIEGEI